MVNKKSVNLLLVFGILLVLSFSLISASWFSDFFDKITGKVVGADITLPTSMINGISSNDVVSGTASDNMGVSKVELTIYNYNTGQRYDGNKWITSQNHVWFPVTGTTSWSWNAASILTIGHQYELVSRATDTAGNIQNLSKTGSTTFTYSPTPCLLAIATSSLPSGTVGSTYSQSLTASGCSSPYYWYIDYGSLPPGLEFSDVVGFNGRSYISSTGVISGIPEAVGTYNFVVAVYKDQYNYITTKQFAMTVNSSSQPITQCIDTDGGKNYYVKGTFSGVWLGEFITNNDSCVDALDETGDDVYSSNYLGEGYCGNNQLKVERVTCPNGCVDGACLGVADEQYTLEKGQAMNIDVDDTIYTISVESMSSNSVYFILGIVGMQGHESVPALSEGETYKFKDDILIAVNDITYQDYVGGIKQVTFSLIDVLTEPTCTDSDGGKNYYVKGTFSGLWEGAQITNTDSCVDALDETGDDVYSSNYLGEGYCGDNQLKVERVTCPNGCVDGACIKEEGKHYYPEPFVSNGTTEKPVAIVYGMAVSFEELDVARKIESNLRGYLLYNSIYLPYLVKDSELDSILNSHHIIVVGTIKECANSAMLTLSMQEDCNALAKLLGISEGQFAIASFDDIDRGDENYRHLLVIGAGLKELIAAEEYLRTYPVETDVGAIFIGNIGPTSGQESCEVQQLETRTCLYNGRNYVISRDTRCQLEISIEGVSGHDTIDASSVANGNGEIKLKNGVLLGVANSCDEDKLIITFSGNGTESITSCDNGCYLDGDCYPYNNRKSGNYCAVGGVWVAQVEDGGSCENNFECSSYVCASGQCVEGSLIQKILAWFRELFS